MPCCSRCGRRVYAAEEKLALGRSWHVECFTCAICNRFLDSSNLSEGKIRDEIYCNSCYRKYLGLQGYGFGSTAPTLVNHHPLIFEKLPHDCPNDEKYTENCVQDPRLIPPPPSRLGQSFMSKIRMPFYYQNHPSLKPGDPCATPPLVRSDCEDSNSGTISSNFYNDSNRSDPSSNSNSSDPSYEQSESEDWRSIPQQRSQPLSPSSINRDRHRNFQLSTDEDQKSQKYCLPSPPRRNLQPKIDYDDIAIAPNPPCPPGNPGPYRNNYNRHIYVEKSSNRKY